MTEPLPPQSGATAAPQPFAFIRAMSTKRKIAFATAGVIVLTLIATLFGYGPFASQDFTGSGSEQVTVRVHPGDSLSAIGRALNKAGVVKSVRYFVNRNASDSRAQRIQPGFYVMFSKMASVRAFNRFFDPTARLRTKVLVPDGARATAIVERLSERTGIPIDDFNAAISHTPLPAYAKGNIEGFLWPATYFFDPDATAESIINELVTTAVREHRRLDIASATAQLTAREVLTLASIIQVEAYPKDYAKVSRVVYNRIARGQRLQMDSTLNYALGTAKWSFTAAEHRNPSPYNTFMHDGLPIGPIGNPGAKAIVAALNPAPGPWLFFVTTNPDTGLTEFATTGAEFTVLRHKFRQWLATK